MTTLQLADVAADTTDPRAGLRAVVSLRALADTLELKQVEAALAVGMSWQAIAEALGVTRQAVHKKYSKRVHAALRPERGA